jgi:hypothetical protein
MLKTPSKQWLLLLLAGIAVIVSLGQLPNLDPIMQARYKAVAVYQPLKLHTLTDDHLVDAMVKLSLRAQLVKVGWDHAILTVDILATKPDEVWKDMERLILFSYSEVHNVKQVLIRVYRDKGEHRTLLMAAQTRKSDWDEKDLAELQPSIFLINPEFTSKIRLALTPAGRLWLTNFSIS